MRKSSLFIALAIFPPTSLSAQCNSYVCELAAQEWQQSQWQTPEEFISSKDQNSLKSPEYMQGYRAGFRDGRNSRGGGGGGGGGQNLDDELLVLQDFYIPFQLEQNFCDCNSASIEGAIPRFGIGQKMGPFDLE